MRLHDSLLFCLAAAVLLPSIASSHTLDKLILTQHWPITFCTVERCNQSISYWTLHGLWPDNGAFCNSSWHFNSSEIEDLLPEMKQYWPNLFNPGSTTFWKNEWRKHGTCAAKTTTLNTQHKYFAKTLELYHKLDLNSVLRKFGITPSENYYTLQQVEGVLENFYRVKPKIQCVHPSKSGDFQTLAQLEICFNLDYKLENCTHSHQFERRVKASDFSVCDQDLPIYYPPTVRKKMNSTTVE
ncbi:ribonuclease T2 [Synchiropus picturatus]